MLFQRRFEAGDRLFDSCDRFLRNERQVCSPVIVVDDLGCALTHGRRTPVGGTNLGDEVCALVSVQNLAPDVKAEMSEELRVHRRPCQSSEPSKLWGT